MRSVRVFCWVASAILSCTLGACSGGPDAATVEAQNKANDLESKFKVGSAADLKQRLTGIAESGVGGSALAGLRSSIDGLRTTNAALADALLGDLTALERAGGPDDIKRIAAQMASRL